MMSLLRQRSRFCAEAGEDVAFRVAADGPAVIPDSGVPLG